MLCLWLILSFFLQCFLLWPTSNLHQSRENRTLKPCVIILVSPSIYQLTASLFSSIPPLCHPLQIILNYVPGIFIPKYGLLKDDSFRQRWHHCCTYKVGNSPISSIQSVLPDWTYKRSFNFFVVSNGIQIKSMNPQLDTMSLKLLLP